jgi:hypothetical protein
MRSIGFLWAVLLSTAICAAADAADPEDQARAHFDRGIELYEQGRFDQAAVAFERAYELKPSFRILFNIGQVENELGHFAAALDAYTRYLAEGGEQIPDERMHKVEVDIERLKTLVGTIVVRGAPDGAIVLIDNEERGQVPLSDPIPVDLGRHEVSLERGSERLLTRVVKVAGGEEVVLTVAGDEAGGGGTVPGDAEPEPVAEEGPRRVWTWVAFGIGAAAGIGAGVTGGLALKKEGEVRDQCTGKQCPSELSDDFDTVETLALTTDVLIGVAAAGVIAGTLLYFFEPDDEAEVQVSAAPAATPAGGGLVIGGRF